MIIRKDEIVLKRIQEDDIELIRNWRNSPDINQYMEFRDYISGDMQHEWFNSVNNSNNLYFLIITDGKKIGLANGKNINWNERTIEGGIFLWDKDYYGTHVPVYVYLILSELLLNVLNLVSYGRVLKDNIRAQRFDKMLGYELCEGQENVENQLYKLTKESYQKKAGKFREAFLKMKDQKPTEIILEQHDYNTGFGKFFESQFDPDTIKDILETEEGKVFRF